MIRWVRQGRVRRTTERAWLLGLVVVVTHPRPAYRRARVLVLPAVPAISGMRRREQGFVLIGGAR